MNRPLAALAITIALLAPSRLWAHAHLKRSSPSAGARVSAPPQMLQLWFSEQPELSMTFVSLKDSLGTTFQLSAAEREPSGVMGVRFRVVTSLKAGRYTVSWRTAAADGHPTSGKFTFVVLAQQISDTAVSPLASVRTADSGISRRAEADTANTEETSSDAADAPDAASVGNSIARAFLFVALLAVIGAVAFKVLVLRGARLIQTELKRVMSRRAAVVGALSAIAIIVVGMVRVYLESRMMMAMPDMPGMHDMTGDEMMMHTAWGLAYLIQIAAAIVALVAFILARREVRGAWTIAVVAALALAITPALGGHAAASPRFTSLMIVADFLHVVGGSAWLGTLLCMLVAGVPIILGTGVSDRWESVSSLVNSFSPIALVSAGVVVASGVFASSVHLGTISALWSTTYGKTLVVKLIFVAATLAIGAFNFKRLQPVVSTESGTEQLRRSAAVELGTGILILVVTGFLTGISP
jgi:putative copper export protein/methionine-rich copper-binding protein CopC